MAKRKDERLSGQWSDGDRIQADDSKAKALLRRILDVVDEEGSLRLGRRSDPIGIGHKAVRGYVARNLLFDLAGIKRPAKGASKSAWKACNAKQKALFETVGLQYDTYTGVCRKATTAGGEAVEDLLRDVTAME
jgi:hypothetical protein